MVGLLEQLLNIALAPHQLAPAALDARLDPEDVGARSLRVEIPEQGARAVACREVGQVDRRRGLSDTALDVVGREDARHPNVFFTRARCSGEENAAKRSLNSARTCSCCSIRRSISTPIAISAA